MLKNKITIDEIAKIAQVSKSTVSKALNNRADVSETTKQKILDIVQKHEYTPNVFGKGLKSKKTNNVGVIFTREDRPLSNNPFFSRVLEGIEAELALNGYNLVLNIIPENDITILPRMIREQQVDGLILMGVFLNEFVERLKQLNIPVVQVDPKTDIPEISQVSIDNVHGGYVATQYLVKMGHKRIGFVSGDFKRLSFKQRLEGYKKALISNGIRPDEKLVRASGIEDGYQLVKSLMEQEHPTALIASNDLNALHGYNALNDLQLKIPDDISIVGFDDIWLSEIATPPLTTIRVYKEELGSIGVRTLLRSISGEIDKPVTTIIPIRLVERKSVMKCPVLV